MAGELTTFDLRPHIERLEEEFERLGRILLVVLAVGFDAILLSITLSDASRHWTDAAATAGVVTFVASLVAVLQVPVSGWWVVALQRQRYLLSDPLRVAASAGGVSLMLAGWVVTAVSSGPAGKAVGCAVIALGATAAPAAFLAPRPASTQMNRSSTWAFVLLLVVLFVAFAIPKFDNTKEKAYVASMKSDLRNFVTWQEEHFTRTGSYATLPDTSFWLSTGVSFVEVRLTPDGFTARARHARVESECVIYLGSTPLAPAQVEAEPRCTPIPNRGLVRFGWYYLALVSLVTALVAWRITVVRRFFAAQAA